MFSLEFLSFVKFKPDGESSESVRQEADRQDVGDFRYRLETVETHFLKELFRFFVMTVDFVHAGQIAAVVAVQRQK